MDESEDAPSEDEPAAEPAEDEPAEDEPAEDEPAEEAYAPSGPPERRTPWWSIAAVGLAFVLLAGATLLTWRQASHADARADRLERVADDRRDVGLAAAAFGAALLSYDFKDLNAARATVLALSTDTFASNYNAAFDNGLNTAIVQLQATAKATVRANGVFVTDVENDKAAAIVILDSQVNSTAGVRPVQGSYLELHLLRQNGAWKVDTVSSISVTSDSLAPSPTTSTTLKP